MPFGPKTIMDLREEFVLLALAPGANRRQLCRRFNVSPPTAYKWIDRYVKAGQSGLADHSRRPLMSPRKSSIQGEEKVIELRKIHPEWGARKLRRLLMESGGAPPSASTITAILKRAGLAHPAPERLGEPLRFERERPNELWQMDFKGPVALGHGQCQILDVLDDHSRFCLGLDACPDQRAVTVQACLQRVFERFGLPERMLMDNGSPWRASPDQPYSGLTVWLMRLGVAVSHGRPYHPQTQGKIERFHGTLDREVLRHMIAGDREACQRILDAWRVVYNFQRPHDALGLETPATRWQPSARSMPASLPEIEYAPGDAVRKATGDGRILYERRRFCVGLPFSGLPVALRPTARDGFVDVFFCHQKIAEINLHEEAGAD